MDALLKRISTAKHVPTEITPCTITEAVVEVRFEPSVSVDAVYGILYNKLKPQFPTEENLPISEFPSIIRLNDPDFRFTPYHKLQRENLLIQIGPRVFSVVCKAKYIGWTNFVKELENAFQALAEANVVSKPLRLGMRYISLFEGNIFSDLDLSLNLDNQPLSNDSTTIKTSVQWDGFTATLVAASGIKRSESAFQGSVIDIDVFMEPLPSEFLRDHAAIIGRAHDLEKKIFFSIFKEPFKRFDAKY